MTDFMTFRSSSSIIARSLRAVGGVEVRAGAQWDLGRGAPLAEIGVFFCAALPKVRGGSFDELGAETRGGSGRASGRPPAGGAARDAPHRPRLDVQRYV